MIHPERVRPLNDRPVRTGAYVLYWMQASVRTHFNHALEHAIRAADTLGVPVVAGFGLTEHYPEANARHYVFLLEGLRDAAHSLAERGIPLVVRRGDPDAVAAGLAQDAAQVVTDMGYLRHQRAWRARLAESAACLVEQVETDAVVPVETAAGKEAWSAATLRPRLRRHHARFLVPVAEQTPRRSGRGLGHAGLDLSDLPGLVEQLDLDRSVGLVPDRQGGEESAREILEDFLARGLRGYAAGRNEPADDHTSHLAAYLHFGHISPLEIALAVRRRRGADADAFLEQLLVRRELSLNFCHYNPRYDDYASLPSWARGTLARHTRDPRPALYADDQLERAQTGDRYWNASQSELVRTGHMHNVMRMYWGKKILEWSRSPEEAFCRALRLNNKYQLDGRDPNSYAGVAWVFGKHDRPWGERAVFGTVRSMTAGGLERKYDMDRYVAQFS